MGNRHHAGRGVDGILIQFRASGRKVTWDDNRADGGKKTTVELIF